LDLQLISAVIGNTGIGISFIPLLLYVFQFKKLRSKTPLPIAILIFEYFLINAFNLFDAYFHYRGLSFLYETHYIIESILILLIFTNKINSRFTLPIIILIIFILIFGLSDFFQIDLTIHPFTLIAIVSNFIFSLVYILFQYKHCSLPKLTDDGIFIMAIGILVFSSVQFYFFMFDEFIRYPKSKIVWLLWPIFQVAGIMHYSLFSIGLWKLRK